MKKLVVVAMVLASFGWTPVAHAGWSPFLAITSAASYSSGDFIVYLAGPTGAGCPADSEVAIQLGSVNRREATALIMTAQAMGKRISVADAGCSPGGQVYLAHVAVEP